MQRLQVFPDCADKIVVYFRRHLIGIERLFTGGAISADTGKRDILLYLTGVQRCYRIFVRVECAVKLHIRLLTDIPVGID